MRIIAGEFKGRRLDAPPGRDTRPILDRQKESLFNVLSPLFPCAGALDLFAGSGSLGLEALSRGAGRVSFVESGRAAQKALQANVTRLGAGERCALLRDDALQLDPRRVQHPVGLIFCDPPFPLYTADPPAVARTLEALSLQLQLEEGAVLMLRIPRGAPEPQALAGFEAARRRPEGESLILLFQLPV